MKSLLNMDVWTVLKDFAYGVWIAGLTVYMVITNRRKATNNKIDQIEKEARDRINAHDTRIVCLENDVRHLPTQADFRHLIEEMSEMKGIINNMNGRMGGLNRAVDLMNEFLINRGDK